MTGDQKDIVIAVDAMGGDLAPKINLIGSLLALKECEDLSVCLVGNETLLKKELRKRKFRKVPRLSVQHAEDVITMDDHAASVIRKKKNSSIHVGLELVRDGKAHAFISAGNSGAVMAESLVTLGRMADVERPAILIKLPTQDGFVILLDAGANVDCKPSHLVQFAEMGRLFAESVEEISNPTVGLLSNGSEEHKGNELTRTAHSQLLEAKMPGYVGYIEGFDLFKGKAHVVVCDGFVGNVALKLAEGLADTAFQWFRKEIKRDVVSLVGLTLMRKILRRFRKKFDYQTYGAAPLLGINGVVLISHGSSTEMAIRNGILTAKKVVEQKLTEKMMQSLASYKSTEEQIK